MADDYTIGDFINKHGDEKVSKVMKLIDTMPDNHMVIKIQYTYFVVPYKDGIKILEAFKNAELVNKDSYNDPKITPVPLDCNVTAEPLSHEKYTVMKMMHILGVPSKDPEVNKAPF